MGFYIVDKQNDQLKHYGVIGMEWGIRRAKKNNTSYVYRSYGQKRYEKKLAAAKTKNADKKTISKYESKLNTFKSRDEARQRYAERTSAGKIFVKKLIFNNEGSYNRMRSAGYGRVVSFLEANALPVGINVAVSKHLENKRARKKV